MDNRIYNLQPLPDVYRCTPGASAGCHSMRSIRDKELSNNTNTITQPLHIKQSLNIDNISLLDESQNELLNRERLLEIEKTFQQVFQYDPDILRQYWVNLWEDPVQHNDQADWMQTKISNSKLRIQTMTFEHILLHTFEPFPYFHPF
ncbi:unnamed protein product [Euphydryas editha]|uniref:Uncharacterized protein n=1 Tax=Euphydryas editha TaxID=104508 RepID=A0AAU9TEQ4_EUPED|nr:unnamed protein product [Euphydryas editha]